VSRAGLREGAGAGEPRRGRVATATTRQWSSSWGSDEASGNGGGLERKRESERRKKKGRQAAGDEADFMCGAHVRNGAFYSSGRGSLRDSLKVN
jgi:hypothetical protein